MMVRNPHAESMIAEEARRPEPATAVSDQRALRAFARELAGRLGWLPGTPSSSTFSNRCRALDAVFKPVFAGLNRALAAAPTSNDVRWLHDNVQLIFAELRSVPLELKPLKRLPHVHGRKEEIVPRVLVLAQAFLDQTGNRFSEEEFSAFCTAFQESAVLDLRELNALVSALKLVLLERIAARARALVEEPASADGVGVGVCVQSLSAVAQTTWKEVLEPLIAFDRFLQQDPAGCYAAMEYESRQLYRERLAQIAKGSDLTEMGVAREVLNLAQQAAGKTHRDPRTRSRESHVGYYLVAEGRSRLEEKVGYRPTFGQRLPALLRHHPDEFLLPGITLLTFTIITTVLLLMTPADSSPLLMLLCMLMVLLPSSQAAVQLMNYLTVAVLKAEILPKADFSDGVPENCLTLIAVPTLLLDEAQVRRLVEDLEVRYLGNHDPNIHFALLSDLADADQPESEDSPLVELCSALIRELNERYSARQSGSFFLFHRHRVYNPREKGWMGWERKRGKLLDLNKLMRGQYDSFPVKVGDLSILPKVRFVITLDSDTELPRGSAHRMIGTLAHPLNQAIVDPEKNIVVAGYGILQPRVGVSVQSTARSRLAAIYAGETGIDVYTRAISDAYQDLYGEGSFTGKGIYEVDTVQQVLDRRFPRNALLSHDLIEGAYARAGLASDIEVIEDYPSHYSAYNRRKHRWLRGDWQIAGWLNAHVREESGRSVPNPISLVSRWKILDNLRRSLVEPATFVLLVFGWLAPGRHPVRWTVATLCILFLPSWFELVFGLVRAALERKLEPVRQALSTLFATNVTVLLNLVFMAHQMLLSLDAVARAQIRRLVTRQRLLEWETAEEAEVGERRTPIDRYLDWMPFLAVVVGLLIWVVRPSSLIVAAPILLLWAGSKLAARWLNESPSDQARELSRKDGAFLRRAALYTWRYFAELSSPEHNWLIPDNVQEEPAMIAARVSPTNLGLLLNARQVAVELGYLTVPDLAALTQKTLATLARLAKHRGHMLNWYDTRTLEPMAPFLVSSVDSGNLLASLWTLQQGLLDTLRKPILSPVLTAGLVDCLHVLGDQKTFSRKLISRCEAELEGEDWLGCLLDLPDETLRELNTTDEIQPARGTAWFRQEAQARLWNIRETVRQYVPWCLPEFRALRVQVVGSGNTSTLKDLPLQQLPDLIGDWERQLDQIPPSTGEESLLRERLKSLLNEARSNAIRLIEDLQQTSTQAGELANAMDFEFLLDKRRKLLSIGFDVQSQKLQPACYDLLATESRTAMFVAIAKEDVLQDCWFRLGRAHTLDLGRPVLLSWSGTMFEYLMPDLWMRSHPNTLLARSRIAAVGSQQDYARHRGVPWGVSESAYSERDESGNYQYFAFGLQQLALMRQDEKALVISPYSSFLALNVDRDAALHNLRCMEDLRWFGSYGFYEAADYTISSSRFRASRCEVVRCWMAHHQGMSLLSLANLLCNNVVQDWFHSDRRVQATELLLHEKPVSHVSREEVPYGTSAA